MKICSFIDCGREAYARELCPGHYSASSKGRPLKPLRSHARKAVPKCTFGDCGRNAHACGLCSTHNRQRLQGLSLAPVTRGRPCSVADCGKEHVGRGYCKVHYNVWSSYRIDPAVYDRMLAAQGGVCAICEQKCQRHGDRLSVDHDHATGDVRGLLCILCNLSVGGMRDDSALLRKAADYLDTAHTRRVPLGHVPISRTGRTRNGKPISPVRTAS